MEKIFVYIRMVSAQGDLISILVKVFRVIISFVRFDIMMIFLEYVFVLSCIIYMYIYERENLLNIENKDWCLIPSKWYLWTLCDSLYILVYDVYNEF